MKNIILIILNFNDSEHTIKLLKKTLEYECLSHIIVIDNHSTDNSLMDLQAYTCEKITILSSSINGGYAKGNNIALRYASEHFEPDYFLIANPDICINENVLYKLYDLIEANKQKRVGLITASMQSRKEYKCMTAWKLPRFFHVFYNNFVTLKSFTGDSTQYSKKYLRQELCEVDVISGSCFLASAAAMKEIDYFDENTFLYCEENILAFKLKNAGYTNLLYNKASYEHEHSISIDANTDSLYNKYMYLYDSLLYYNRQYLNTNIIQNFLFKLSFKFGLNFHIALKKILRK